jgi:hypothetical protein
MHLQWPGAFIDVAVGMGVVVVVVDIAVVVVVRRGRGGGVNGGGVLATLMMQPHALSCTAIIMHCRLLFGAISKINKKEKNITWAPNDIHCCLGPSWSKCGSWQC